MNFHIFEKVSIGEISLHKISLPCFNRKYEFKKMTTFQFLIYLYVIYQE